MQSSPALEVHVSGANGSAGNPVLSVFDNLDGLGPLPRQALHSFPR